jgi:hypothetical protein
MPRTPPTSLKLATQKLHGLLCQMPFSRLAWSRACAPGLHVRVGNAPPSTELDESLDALAGFYSRITGWSFAFVDICVRRQTVFIETDVVVAGDRLDPLLVPCAIIARMKHDLIHDLRIYLDPEPLCRLP